MSTNEGESLVTYSLFDTDSVYKKSGLTSKQRSSFPKKLWVVLGALLVLCLAMLGLIILIIFGLVRQQADVNSLKDGVQILHDHILLHEDTFLNGTNNSMKLENDHDHDQGNKSFQRQEKQKTHYLKVKTEKSNSLLTRHIDKIYAELKGLKEELKGNFKSLNMITAVVMNISGSASYDEISFTLQDIITSFSDNITGSITHFEQMLRGQYFTSNLTKEMETFMKYVFDNETCNTCEKIDAELALLNNRVKSVSGTTLDLIATIQPMMRAIRNISSIFVHEGDISQLTSLQERQIELIEMIGNMTNVQQSLDMSNQTKFISEISKQFQTWQSIFETNFTTLGCLETSKMNKRGAVDVAFCTHGKKCVNSEIESKYCYTISRRKDPLVSWEQAKAICSEMGSYLVEVKSLEEMDALKQFVDPDGKFWLGGTDVASEGHWLWHHSRMPIALGDWNEGEPNNFLGEEHCLHTSRGIEKWNDEQCNKKYRFICQRDGELCNEWS